MNRMPDMVPTLPVPAAFAGGRTRIRNAAHLRVKESDRLRVVALEPGNLGVPVLELADGLETERSKLRGPGSAIQAHDDHRIAMARRACGSGAWRSTGPKRWPNRSPHFGKHSTGLQNDVVNGGFSVGARRRRQDVFGAHRLRAVLRLAE